MDTCVRASACKHVLHAHRKYMLGSFKNAYDQAMLDGSGIVQVW